MSHILVTGATGLLGRYLMKDLLLNGRKLAVLVRKSRRQSPWQRVEAAMRSWEQVLNRKLPRPKVLAGDISSADLGLSPEDAEWAAANCSELLHNAASLSFVSTGRTSEPWRTNVDGTRYVLDYCDATGIRKFHHVSTAYVCGLREGLIRENELNIGQEFANPYEESKVESETMVREAGFDSLTVFRPGIIIGDSRNGISFTYHNYYWMLQLADTLSRQTGVINFTGKNMANYVQLNIDGTERKNFVPVDWVSEAMARIIVNPQLHGETYHLTPRVPVTMRLVRDVMEEVVGFYGIGFYGAGERRQATHESEEIFHQQMEVYASYWRDDPTFDSSNITRALPDLPCPHVDRPMLQRLSRVAIKNRFDWKDPKVEAPAAAQPVPV